MKHKVLYTGIAALFAASSAWAVPVLQVGAPAPDGSGEGIYADYQGNTTNPTEEKTAITSGDKLYVGGVYGSKTLFLGGQFLGNGTYPAGLDWSQVDKKDARPTAFDGHGAILVVSVPDSLLASALSSLQINNQFAFYSDANNSYFGNNHDPMGISGFLFFDIGSFGNTGSVSNFVDESDSAAGQIKELTLSGFGALPWVHFDVMALETDPQGTRVKTSAYGNPGSHDVTWKPDGPPSQELPEPGTLALLGLGLLGFGASRRYQKKK